MTILFWIGFACWVLMVVIGTLIKRKTRERVSELDGVKGVVMKREQRKYGDIVAKLED